MAVPAEVEDNGPAFATLFALERLLQSTPNRVAWFRGRQDALGPSEAAGAVANRPPRPVRSLDQPGFPERADLGTHAMVAQTASVDGRGHEVMPQSVHFDQWRHLCCIAEIVAIDAPGEAGRSG